MFFCFFCVCVKVASIRKHYCFYRWPDPCRIEARELPSGMTTAITVTAPGPSGVNSLLLDRAVIYFSSLWLRLRRGHVSHMLTPHLLQRHRD